VRNSSGEGAFIYIYLPITRHILYFFTKKYNTGSSLAFKDIIW